MVDSRLRRFEVSADSSLPTGHREIALIGISDRYDGMDMFVVRYAQKAFCPDVPDQRNGRESDKAGPEPHAVGCKQDVLRSQQGILFGGASPRL